MARPSFISTSLVRRRSGRVLADTTRMKLATRELVNGIAEMEPRQRASIDRVLHFLLCALLAVFMIGGALAGYFTSEALRVSSHTLGFVGLLLGLLMALGVFVCVRFTVFSCYLRRRSSSDRRRE